MRNMKDLVSNFEAAVECATEQGTASQRRAVEAARNDLLAELGLGDVVAPGPVMSSARDTEMSKALDRAFRNAVIEECAKAAESCSPACLAASAVRALAKSQIMYPPKVDALPDEIDRAIERYVDAHGDLVRGSIHGQDDVPLIIERGNAHDVAHAAILKRLNDVLAKP